MPQPGQEDFFSKQKDWSKRKLQLLEHYVEAASKIMASIGSGEVYYVDGFAGEGIYEDGSKGSPVIIAELAQRYQREAKPYSLRCINIEENKKRFANLQTATRDFGSLVTNLQGTFIGNIDEILKIIGDRPAICFLDPFGIKGIDWSGIEKVTNRGSRSSTDFWIRFDTQTASRLYGFFNSQIPNAEQYLETLVSVFGIEDKKYLYSRLAGKTAEERFQNALHLYMQRLANEFKKVRGTGYAGIYPIKTLEGQIKYYLVFATAHSKGITLASEIIYGIEETYQREVQEFKERQLHQLELFPSDPTEHDIFEEKVERLKEDIWKACKGKTLSRTDIYISIVEKWFGKISGRHLNQALKNLKNSGYILKADGAISRGSTRFTFRASD